LKNEEIHRQFEEYKRQSEDKLASALREVFFFSHFFKIININNTIKSKLKQ